MIQATRRLMVLSALASAVHVAEAPRAWAIEPAAPSSVPVPSAQAAGSSQAERFRAEADREFAAGNYRKAIEPLARGYALTHDARFLLNLGVTYHWLGECELARDNYEAFLKVATDGPQRAEAVQALEALYPLCGRSGAAPPSPRSPRESHAVPDDTLPNVAAPSNSLAWSLISVGGGALLGAAVTGVLWRSSRSEYRELTAGASSRGQTWEACCADRGERLEASMARYRALTAGFGVGSAVLIAAGAALWRSQETEPAGLSLALGDGLGLRYGAAF